MTQGFEEQIRPLPTIEPELHLFEVGREMLGADSMPRSHNPALQEAESGFNRIGMNVSHNVDTAAVLNCLMIFVSGFLNRYRIRRGIVSHNHVNIFADIFADESGERSRFG